MNRSTMSLVPTHTHPSALIESTHILANQDRLNPLVIRHNFNASTSSSSNIPPSFTSFIPQASNTNSLDIGAIFITDPDNDYQFSLTDDRFEIISPGPNSAFLRLKPGQTLPDPVNLTITGIDTTDPTITYSQTITAGGRPNPLTSLGGIPAIIAKGIAFDGLGGNKPIIYNYNNLGTALSLTQGLTLREIAGNSFGNPTLTLNRATVKIAGAKFKAGLETLGITGQNGTSGTLNQLTWTYDSTTGTLTIHGTGNYTTYQAALRQVTYSATAGATGDRALQIYLDNYGGGSLGIKLASSNPTTISGLSEIPFTYYSNRPDPIAPNLTINAGIAGKLYNQATVSIVGSFNSTQDRLNINGDTTGTINGLTWTYNSTTGILSITGPGSAGVYQSVLQKVAYRNENPTPGARTIAYSLGTGSSAITTSTRIDIGDSNLPRLRGFATGGTFYSQNGQTLLAPELNVDGRFSSIYFGATVRISGANFNPSHDRLSAGDSNQTNGSFTTGLTWNYEATTGILTITGMGNADAYGNILRQIYYSNTSDNPTLGSRSITYTLDDGGTPTIASTQITIRERTNEITGFATNGFTYNPALPETAIAPNLKLSGNIPNGRYAKATVRFSGAFNPEDRLGLVGQNDGGVQWSYDNRFGTLTISGPFFRLGGTSFGDLASYYENLLRQVTYRNSNPSIGTRTLIYTIGIGPDAITGKTTLNIPLIA